MCAPTLIVGFGNPSRGDDALGPTAIAEIERRMAYHPAWGKVDILTDFQLQIEFVTDLADRRCVVFIDASATGAEPFLFEPLQASPENPYTTHALSPASLLTVYRNFHGENAPPSFLLGIRGYEFDLGAPLSVGAASNLEAAITMLEQWLTERLAE
ncbi:MAG: hydrogenase maturation protease [Burkholderiales bacterium]